MKKIKLTDRIRKWFSGQEELKQEELKQEEPKQSDFIVEHYPLTGRFYPKYKNKYLIDHYDTGIISITGDHMFPFTLYGETENGADLIIERFKEHQLKETVRVIQK